MSFKIYTLLFAYILFLGCKSHNHLYSSSAIQDDKVSLLSTATLPEELQDKQFMNSLKPPDFRSWVSNIEGDENLSFDFQILEIQRVASDEYELKVKRVPFNGNENDKMRYLGVGVYKMEYGTKKSSNKQKLTFLYEEI